MPTAIDFVPDEEASATKIDFQPDPEPGITLNVDARRTIPKSTTSGGPRAPLASAAETLSSIGQEAGDISARMNEPILHLPEPLTEQERGLIQKHGTKGENVALGATKAIEDSANWFTSPLGIATLGIGALPRAAQRVAAGLFATQMASQVPEISQELGKEFAKPESQRDYQKISELATSGALATGFTAMAGKHALAPGPKPVVQGPLATGRVLETPEGALPPEKPSIPDQAIAPAVEEPAPAGAVTQPVVAPPVEPTAPPAAPAEATSAVQSALENWKGTEKRWRRAMRQDPSDRDAADEARMSAQAEFEQAAKQAGISQEHYDVLKSEATATETERPAPPTVVPEKQSQGVPVVAPVNAVDKAGVEIENTITSEGSTTAKGKKSQLVESIEQAIESAPSEEKFPGLKEARGKDANEKRAKFRTNAESVLNEGKNTGQIKKVTIDIPGDGKFTVWNTKENLQELLDRAKKISTKANDPTKIKKRGSSDEDKAWVAEQVEAAKSQVEKEHPTLPGTEAPPLAFGGGTRAPKPAPPTTEPVSQEDLAALVKRLTPGSGIVSGIKRGIQSLLFPSAMSKEHLRFAEKLGKHLGAMHRRAEVAREETRPSERMFTRLGVDRDGVAPKDNPGIKFMSAMSQGADLPPKLQKVADLVQKLFGERLAKLQDVGAPLQTVRENYFPGMWTKESRRAFNAAMDEATTKGLFGKGFDVNDATPEQRATIKARVDEFLKQGVGSDKDALQYLSRRPMKGTESFRKPKVFDDIMDAAEFGLRPISNNPIDPVRLKLAEMDRSIMANGWFQELKGEGNLKIISPYEKVPEGWVKVNDKYGTIYGKPTVTVPEHVDKAVYEGLLAAAEKIGVRHERSMKFPPGQGNRALGLSYQGQNFVRTRFATETSVLAHEIGHQIDHKYNLWQEMTSGETGRERKIQVQKELRVIADMTGRSDSTTRTKVEKIAQLMEAYVHAPDRMMKEAPYLFNRLENFLKSKPELEGITQIRPGLELTKLTGEKYVGLPIMGYRIVPEAAGAIMNNYLSSSLYNSPHFGTLYKGWMGAANALNQSQLGWGSAFHAGFTTIEAQVSANANVVKDVFGALKGNRSLGDLAKTAGNAVTAAVRTAVTGDSVLNAWRDPNGRIDPKIAQVVKAAELAGGGFKMESGMVTMQGEKAFRDWYSGHRLRAAARSPVAALELAAKPIMEYLVPRQKAGVFADLAWRIIEQNPDKSLEELTPEFRAAWNRVDARLGQVRYDRLFMNNVAKNVVQGLVRAPGWSGGTIAELGGAFKDAGTFLSEWVSTGKLPENIPDRTAYAISLLLTIGAANAALTYAFTGTQPKGMDFLAFRTGKKDEKGLDERFMLPSYIKDILAYAKAPVQTLMNKSHPLISMISDLAKNKDYYGVEIRDKEAGVSKQAAQSAGYVVKAFEPFWTRGARKESSREAGSVRTAAPFFGVMPAPPQINNTAAENLASELLHRQFGERTITREQFERSKQLKEAASAVNRGDKSIGDVARQGLINQRSGPAFARRATLPYLDYAVTKLSAKAAVDVYAKSSPEERARIHNLVGRKLVTASSLSPEQRNELRARFEALSR